MTEATAVKLKKKDFQTDQEVRWCPGCGDYAILAAVQSVFPTLGIPREKFVVVSGIGCSSRFPYYMNTYGFHTIHGRAPAFATGIKLADPSLNVWLVTGDGDGLSIGGNHLMHVMRRNVGIKLMLFNNRIYGLTKGQYSPTSEVGKRTKSTPMGSVDAPVNPLVFALGCGATFVACGVDVYARELQATLGVAATHEGVAFTQIFQNCNIFNDHAFEHFTERSSRSDTNIFLEHGKPLIFGADRNKGLVWNSDGFEVVTIGENGVTEADIAIHDQYAESPVRAMALARMEPPHGPVPIGILRQVQRPTFESGHHYPLKMAREKQGDGSIAQLLDAGDTWEVK